MLVMVLFMGFGSGVVVDDLVWLLKLNVMIVLMLVVLMDGGVYVKNVLSR